MPKKKFALGQTYGFIGDKPTKSKTQPYTEPEFIKEYRAKRDSFDWTPEPPAYTGEPVDLQALAKEVFQWNAQPVEIKETKPNKKSEFHLQAKICNWLNDAWPGLIFVADFAAGLFLPPWIAEARKQQSCLDKYPDVTILNPRGGYMALIIEIKTEAGTPYKKDGKTLLSSAHIAAQNKTLTKLKALGYCACFGVGETQIKRIVAKYMAFEQTPATNVLK